MCVFIAVNPERKHDDVNVKTKKKEKTEFKTAPDGRLIIVEEKLEKLPSISEAPDSGMVCWHELFFHE